MKAYLHKQGPFEGKKGVSSRPLKAKNSDLYYRNSYMEYYYLCRQCKDHFDIARAKCQE